MGPRQTEQTPSFNLKCAVTVGPNRTSHLFTTEELEACMYVSCEASLRWPAVWADGKQCCTEHNISYKLYALTLIHTKQILLPLYEQAVYLDLAHLRKKEFIITQNK